MTYCLFVCTNTHKYACTFIFFHKVRVGIGLKRVPNVFVTFFHSYCFVYNIEVNLSFKVCMYI